MNNLGVYYELLEALENLKIKNLDIRVVIKDGEVYIENYETCTVA
jgi:hypothetical protein